MKVLYKPKLKIQKCVYCGAELQIKYRDLKFNGASLIKDAFYCKVCNGKNIVEFDKGENNV